MKKKIILVAGILLFVGTAVLAYSPSAEAESWFTAQCSSGNETGKKAYLCDLRHRVDAIIEINAGAVTAPTFESVWVVLSEQSTVFSINHSMGGDVDDYFVELSVQRNNPEHTMTNHELSADKIWWQDLDTNVIRIVTNGDVSNLFYAVRVRIWTVAQ